MYLKTLKISNFQSFGPEPVEINLNKMNFLLGPNGSGKTVVLQALSRLFAFNPSGRRILVSDFHVPQDGFGNQEEVSLYIEAHFILPECIDEDGDSTTIPPSFSHMRLEDEGDFPSLRFRLTASMGLISNDIEEKLQYVTSIDESGEPTNLVDVSRADRNSICVHYLPARRDPAEHINYGTTALLGRILRATNWESEIESFTELSESIVTTLSENLVVQNISQHLREIWGEIHRGDYLKTPAFSFGADGIDTILKNITLSFSPNHHSEKLDYSRLSDGQKSILYLSLVLASLHVQNSSLEQIDISKLRPAYFTIIAVEEPENSLSPHYLGRIVSALKKVSFLNDNQSIVATHSPSMLKRVEPADIRYLRLNSERRTIVSEIILPPKHTAADDQHINDEYKYVREAVQAFPELYFSRLVLLVEGDSEEIVLPKLLEAKGLPTDEYGISIVPLGGRHVNHFWRLLEEIKIPYVTLLDLDLARHGGGWGRIKYILEKLKDLRPDTDNALIETLDSLPTWNDGEKLIRDNQSDPDSPNYLEKLEQLSIFYSEPLDFDFSMISSYPDAYVTNIRRRQISDENLYISVLGPSHGVVSQYTDEEFGRFYIYHKRFKLGSKPASHFNALSRLDNDTIIANIPHTYERMIAVIRTKLSEIPE